MLSKQPSQQATSNTPAPPGRPVPPHGQGSQTRPVRAHPGGLLGTRQAQWGLRWRVQALLLAMLPLLACAQWKTARATWYDDAAWMSVHSGSCMYGYLGDRFGGNQNWMVAAINDGHMRYSGSCGRCYKIRCKPMAVRDNFGQQIDRNNECYNQDPITVVITDTCPCDKPNNAMSNKRWCCGDMDHFDIGVWAFRKFADPGKGVVGIEYQETPCTASFLQPLNPAVQKPSSLRGQYPFDLDSQHAAARAAASGVPATDQKDATPDTRLATRPPPRPAPIGPISQQKVMEASGPPDAGRRRSD